MLQHILERRWQVQWKWGPVISYQLPLEEIDSAGVSLHDVMELNKGHLNTGIVGVKYLLPALSRGGHVDVALQVTQTDELRQGPGLLQEETLELKK